jgi:hypothetical protein
VINSDNARWAFKKASKKFKEHTNKTKNLNFNVSDLINNDWFYDIRK